MDSEKWLVHLESLPTACYILTTTNMCLMPGDYGGGAIPVPIPNTEVKPSYADDTAPVRGGKVGRCQVFFWFPNPAKAGFFINTT